MNCNKGYNTPISGTLELCSKYSSHSFYEDGESFFSDIHHIVIWFSYFDINILISIIIAIILWYIFLISSFLIIRKEGQG